MRGYAIVSDAMAATGVTHIFGLMGDGNLAVVADAVQRHAVTYLASRHEAGALSMAQGYSFVTKQAGIATTTWGPGLSNAMTALKAAVDLGLPVVLLMGDSPVDQPFHLQNIDHRSYVELTGARWRHVDHPRDLRRSVIETMEAAVREGHPWVLNIPIELLHGEIEAQQAPVVPRDEATHAPERAQLEECAAALAAADRPVVLGGFGVLYSDAAPALQELASHAGALLATTLRARSMFAGDPFDVGISGGFATPMAKELLAEADLVIAFGASLNAWTTHNGSLFSKAKVIHVDRQPSAIGRMHDADIGLCGDVRDVAGALSECLKASPRETPGYRTIDISDRIAQESELVFDDASDEMGIDPRTAMRELSRILGSEARVTIDGGHFISWPSRYLTSTSDSGFLVALGAGSIGHALATSIGAWAGEPDRTSVCVLGDGCLMMSAAELDTAVRSGAQLIIVVVNDGAYSAEIHKLQELDLPQELAHFDVPDLAAVMRSFGGDAVTVTSPDHLQAVEERIGDLQGPLLVDLRVTRRVVSERFRKAELASTVAG